jgi:hypothetical protein
VADGAASPSKRLTEEEVGRFAELEEVPLQHEDDGWDSLYGILERRNRCQHFGLGIEDMLVAHHACGGIANC